MNNNLYFVNSGVISEIDMTTMGDSNKRGDKSKIGKFDSGLKYALAILYKTGVEVKITTGEDKYTFSSSIKKDSKTSKEKNLLNVIKNSHERVETAFSVNLGQDWKFWMAIRELYSNCLDEGGLYFTNFAQALEEVDKHETSTIIEIKKHPLLQEVLDNWDCYFNTKSAITSQSGVKIFDNPEGYLRCYKNNILIYEDKEVESAFIYDIRDASIDEMRMANDKYSLKTDICYAIMNSTDEEFIKLFLDTESKEFEQGLNYFFDLSKAWVNVVNERYKFDFPIKTYSQLYIVFMKDDRIDVGVRRIAQRERYISQDIEVEPILKENIEPSWEDNVKNICLKAGFSLTLPITHALIERVKCIADVKSKCIYVDPSFSEEDVWEIIKESYAIYSLTDNNLIFKDHAKVLKETYGNK